MRICRVSVTIRQGGGVMIDAKAAVQIAKEKAVELLGQSSYGLEEIQREPYKDREVWSITLSRARDMDQLHPLVQLAQFSAPQPWDYKRFLIDAETGDFVAMQIREVAVQ
jgi:hypothetical protein